MKERHQIDKKWLFILLLSVLFVLGFIIGCQYHEMRSERLEIADTVTVVKFDTIETVRDTTIYKLKPKYIEVLKRDTITKDTVLTKESKTYENTLCQDNDTIQLLTTISGYEATIDSVSAKWKKHTVKETEYITVTEKVKEKKKINIGLQVGYGIGLRDKEFQPYIGLGLQYNF